MLYKIITRQRGATLTYVDLTDKAVLAKAASLRSQGVTFLILSQDDGEAVQEVELERWSQDRNHNA